MNASHHLILQLEGPELLEHKVHLLPRRKGRYVAMEILAIVLGVVIGLTAGVQPQAGVAHLAPTLCALLGYKTSATEVNIHLAQNDYWP